MSKAYIKGHQEEPKNQTVVRIRLRAIHKSGRFGPCHGAALEITTDAESGSLSKGVVWEHVVSLGESLSVVVEN